MKRILIVEDESFWLKQINESLIPLPCTVDTATCMQEALTSLRDFKYDIIVSDYMFPLVNESGWGNKPKRLGIELCQSVQKENPKPIFILHTNSGDDFVIDVVTKLGGVYHQKNPDGTVSALIARVKEELVA